MGRGCHDGVEAFEQPREREDQSRKHLFYFGCRIRAGSIIRLQSVQNAQTVFCLSLSVLRTLWLVYGKDS